MRNISIDEQFLLTSNYYKESRRYWEKSFEDFLAQDPILFFDGKRETLPTGQLFTLDPEVATGVLTLCKQNELSVYIFFVAVYSILMKQYKNTPHIAFATPLFHLNGNNDEEGQDYNDFLLLILQLHDEMTFRELLSAVKEKIADGAGHQHYPLADLLASRRLQLSDITETVIASNNIHEGIPDSLRSLPVGMTIDIVAGSIRLDIRGIAGDRVFRHLNTIIRACYKQVSQRINDISLLDDAEEKALLWEYGNLSPAAYAPVDFLSLLNDRLEQGRESAALTAGDRTFSYSWLQEQTGRLTAYLREGSGLAAGSRVVLLADKDEWLVVSILSLLGSDLVYVPVDSSYPEERINYILENVNPGLVMVSRRLAGASWLSGRRVLLVEDVPVLGERTRRLERSTAEQTAYIIYTSGSTGHPKGVQVSHGNLDHLFAYVVQRDGGNGPVVLPMLASPGFDISLFQLFLPLLTGGCIQLVNRQELEDVDTFSTLLQESNMLDTVPGVYQLLLERGKIYPSIKKLFIGGDLVSDGILRRLWDCFPNAAITMMYGPTEGTLFCTDRVYVPGTALSDLRGNIIGRPFLAGSIVLLNSAGALSPLGVEGEICIGGPGVTKGYLGLDAATNTNYRYHEKVGMLLYHTGDMGCWTSSGELEFRGRRDTQVKLSGNRIELGELEHRLAEWGGIEEAVVVFDKEAGYLGAFYTGQPSSREDLEQHLSKYFVGSVLPARYIHKDRFPLTSNGKINRRELLAQLSLQEARVYTAPRNELEQGLVDIWKEVLQRDDIGVSDNFFELGGDSLLAMRVSSRIRSVLGRQVPLRRLFDHPTIAALSGCLQPSQPAFEITPVDRSTRIPLSFAQERLWFIDRLQGSVHYHMPWILRLRGSLDTAKLFQSLQQIVRRHEVLRTVIKEADGIGYQVIQDWQDWTWEERPLDEKYFAAYVEERVQKPFDLSSDYMLRVSLLQVNDEEHVLVVVLHHIAADGWSISILIKELEQLYRRGIEKAQLPALPVQYADYAVWQRGLALDEQLGYWKNKLAALEVQELFTDYARPAVRGIHGGVVHHVVPVEELSALRTYCQQEGVTLYVMLLSVLKVLLYRYTGRVDQCVGSPLAGRDQSSLEGLIGFFIHTHALRSQVDGHAGFRQLLQQVKQTVLEAYEHQEVPFEKIVDALGVERDVSRNPLFSVKFMLQNMPAEDLDLGGVHLSMEDMVDPVAQIDISLDVQETDQGLELGITYSKDIYNKTTIAQMLRHYEQLLRQVQADSELPVGQLQLLTPEEQHQLLEVFNQANPVAPHPAGKTISELFELQVSKTPDAVALIFDDEEVTYRELQGKAERLAARLLQKGIQPDMLVGVCIQRSVDMVVAVLGILKSSAGYLPIDPAYPPERISYMLTNSGSRYVVTTTDLSDLIPDATHVCIDQLPDTMPAGIQWPVTSPDNLAYVIYTSGSTGFPKGVMIEHKGVVNMVYSLYPILQPAPGFTLFQFASLSFDASCYEIFFCLLNGGRLLLSSKETLLDADQFRQLLNRHEVALITLPPSYLNILKEDVPKLRSVISAGEMLHTKLAGELQEKGIRLINAYGPTECTVCATITETPLHDNGNVIIGKPLGNVYAYILDENAQPVPPGVAGELYLGGTQLARGYLNNPVLTAEKFIQHPLGKLYRTGDVARWLCDGNIEFIGRQDDQVKIRGYRVELGEVERALQMVPGIRQAAVVVKEEGEGNKQLVGYLVAEGKWEREAVFLNLQQQLPDYMIPAFLVPLEALPLTVNGKVDRRKLLEIPVDAGLEESYVAPANAIEQTLADIWQELLELPRVGVYDNFFELGGHSLLGVRMISHIRKRLNVTVPVHAIFQFPTVSDLSKYLSINLNDKAVDDTTEEMEILDI